MRKAFIAITSCALVCIVASGCTAIALGGATYATTAAVGTIVDRRTTGTIVDDTFLEKKLSNEIDQGLGKENKEHITVTAYNRRVLLTGEVPSEQAKSLAMTIVSNNKDVREVINELRVQENAGFFERMGDSALATKVRARIIADQKVELNQMKVAVDRGIVYLIGILTAQENKRVCQIAASTSGVARVVSCVEIVTEKETKERMKFVQEQQSVQ